MYRKYFKRTLDVTLASGALVFLCPLFIAVSIYLAFYYKSAIVFFTQQRPGKNGKIFKIIKFKTMTDECDDNGQLLPDEKRLTAPGKRIRETSIDELPQLINVIKGDMSLIGPRPLLKQYLPLYSDEQARRHEVRPGITGWAQCNGRNAITWEEKFLLDIWYVDNFTFLIDIRILWLTVQKVIMRKNISSQTSSTMEPFKGNS